MATTPETSVHRALAEPRRAALVAELEAASVPLDSMELGRRAGLHPNTVRWHLAILADAGLVRSRFAPRAGPGRPRRVYEPTRPSGPAVEHPHAADVHRALATALVGIVAGQPGSADAAAQAGRAWGRRQAATTGPTAHPIERVVAVLDAHGFGPVADGHELTMHRCPFPELARSSPDVVCGLHRGLVDGVLEALGADLEVERLEVLPRPDVCIVHLGERRRAR